MDEEDSVIAKSDFLVEVLYVETSFLGSINVMSVIPRSHGILMNNMNNVLCYMNYDMCYVKYVT